MDNTDLAQKQTAWHVAWFLDHEIIQRDVTLKFAQGQLVEVLPGRRPGATDLGPVAIIPGLVNAHTHLEFSRLTQPIPTQGRFTDWIRQVIQSRRDHPDQVPGAIACGLRESICAGTTLIGEIATVGWQTSDYLNQFQGIVFQELLGLGDERVALQVALAGATRKAPGLPASHWGLSPHAPYSVHPELLQQSIRIASAHDYPVAMHLAETRPELELLASGRGEFREMLQEFGIWREGIFGGQRPLQILQELARAPRALVIHGNYLDQQELEFLASQPQMTLVYCPRTHAAFEHSDHPWRRLRQMGGRVALGTDSRASNPDLSLFAELQFLAARHPDISHLELLEIGTVAGRSALLGSRSDSRSADYCAVALRDPNDDPAQQLFAPKNRVIGTMIRGEWVVAPHRERNP